MDINFLSSIFARIFFIAALVLLGIAGVELLSNLSSNTILPTRLSGGRLIEMSAAFMVFVIAVLLRQIRDAQKPS